MSAKTESENARVSVPTPRPYYDDGTCVIYHGDALEVLYAKGTK